MFGAIKRRQRTLFLITTLIAIIACVSPIVRNPGWAQNHEGLAFVSRTAVYADHLRQGDFVPIWSSADAFGLGTPLPLFYHKTFYYVSSLMLLLLGSMKAAIIVTIMFFMFVGAYGIRAAMQKITDDWVLLLVLPQLFLLSNYVFSNWLIRGAMAEFSAMMILPWILWWCLVLVKDRRFSLAIAPLFFFLFNAHNISSVFALIPMALACAIYLVTRFVDWKYFLKQGAIAAGILTLLVVPQLLLQKAFLGVYDPSKITQSGYLASNNFRPAQSYVYDGSYTWLKDWMQLTVQIDLATSLALAATIVGVAIAITKNKRYQSVTGMRKQLKPHVLLLAGSLMVFLFLQLTLARPIFVHIAPLEFLQFPWRLLSFITPLGILALALVLGAVRRPHLRAGLLAATAIIFLIESPLVHRFQYAFFSQRQIDMQAQVEQLGLRDQISGIGEYLPVMQSNGEVLSSLSTVEVYKQFAATQTRTQVLSGSCTVTESPRTRFEPLEIDVTLRCSKSAVVALPVSYNAFSGVTDTVSGKAIKTRREITDPRLVIVLPAQDKPYRLRIELPTVGRVIDTRL